MGRDAVLLSSPGLHERDRDHCRQNKNNYDGERFKGPHSADLRQASQHPNVNSSEGRSRATNRIGVRPLCASASAHTRPLRRLLLEQHNKEGATTTASQTCRGRGRGRASSWPAKLRQACCLACQSFCKDRLVLDPQSLLHGAVLHLPRANNLRTGSASTARNYCHFSLF